jgi:hypothetical protein
MGKMVLMVAMAVLMLASSALAGLWKVEIENQSKRTQDVYVLGHYFFFAQIECSYPQLKPGEKVTCELPGGICPVSVKVHGLEFPCYDNLPCCWNLRGVIEEDGTPFGYFHYK